MGNQGVSAFLFPQNKGQGANYKKLTQDHWYEEIRADSEIVINFDDSIIEAKQAEREQDRRDVSMGVMRLDEYSSSDIIKSANTKEVIQVHSVGKINKNIYRCITESIITDEVVITDNQIKHITERHPEALDKVIKNLERALADPDFIIKDKHENTGLVIKKIALKDEQIQMVLRICTSEDEPGYKNSIISSWKISEKRLQNYLRNKQILYKKE